MENDIIRKNTLDLLRFPLAIVVLSIHVFSSEGIMIQGIKYTYENYPVFQCLNYIIDAFLRGQSVPIYFFISGYVFFLNTNLTIEKYKMKLHNRFKSLFIPFVLWNVVALLTKFVFIFFFPDYFPGLQKSTLNFSISAIINIFWDDTNGIIVNLDTIKEQIAPIYPINVPLWFVRDLMIVVLFTPIIQRYIKATRVYGITLLGITWFICSYYELGYINQLLTAFLFFSFGAYMSIYNIDMIMEFRKYFKASIVLYLSISIGYVLSIYYYPTCLQTLKNINIIIGMIFAYNIASWLIQTEKIKLSRFLASSSFFIYVTHGIICGIIAKLLLIIIRPQNDFSLIITYCSSIAIVVFFLLGVFYLLRKYTPSLLGILAGRK